MGKIYVDLTSLGQWRGPVVGILRAQQRFAQYARANLPNAVFTVFDPRTARLRPIRTGRVDDIIEGTAKVQLDMLAASPGRRRTVDRLPPRLRETYWWITRFRRKLAFALERRRLDAGSERARDAWAALQRPLLRSARMRRSFTDVGGQRLDLPTIDQLAGAPIVLEGADVTVAIQNDWTHTDAAAILDARDRAGSRHVVLCHDVIPIKFPQWYSAEDVAVFTRYYDTVFQRADKVVFTTRCTWRDALEHCAAQGIALRPHAFVPLGSDAVEAGAGALPEGLEPDRFALYVATLEPRKNHRMLTEAWRRLVRDGTVAASGFKLAFVGRTGWMVDELMRELRTDPLLKDSVVHLTGIGDDTLGAIYRDAAFCLYPSIYEGYGLPPVEALQRGKALIVSNGGSLPEVVGDFAVLLDPDDVAGWTDRMRAWMLGAPERMQLADRAGREYRAATWEESARLFFEAASNVTDIGPGGGSPSEK